MATPESTRNFGDVAADALNDFTTQIFGGLDTVVRRFCRNFYSTFINVSAYRWTRIALIVIGYLLIRPYIEKLFKWSHDRSKRKEKEKKEKEREKQKASGKKAKMSANTLRGGRGGAESGKVLGEVENTEDELGSEDEEGENMANASGVPEWNKMARKRQKKYLKNLEKQAYASAESLTDDQVLELLDWSEEDDAKKA
ncbi:hypothetical protein N7474_007634 [Penicillium riverlandense]|uniref:uncharacterized protein n=1 Tax=Penicillium riverlandense TaxID=1903569 RepID=UPI00254810A7|nr:uncharacterized protein N7474_007634 [Penicillium riverlandense]KAJ5811333.1 hypothetical protein N7474_007634 [Penicillium riverlandense]